MRLAAQPELYDPQSDPPVLLGSRCSVCTAVSFPALALGCEVCGATEEHLQPFELRGQGVLHSRVTVHVDSGQFAAPFTIGEIQLDRGPLIRATLADDAAALQIGQPVVAVWAITSAGADDETVELRFTGATG